MKKTKRKPKQTSHRNSGTGSGNSGGSESPEAVLIAVDKFVATRKAAVDKLTDRAIKKKKVNPAQNREIQIARAELSEALRLRVRVARVVMDVEQRLRLIENSARFAIATAFAEYQTRTRHE